MTYELWETRTGNLIDTFESMSDALEVVRSAIEECGADYVSTWLLGQEDRAGNHSAIAEGKALAERALASSPA